MLDPGNALFCARYVRTNDGLVRVGHSPRYTIMTLLGLRERELSGRNTPFETHKIFASFVRDTSWINGIGDLGLLIWLIAEYDPDQLGVVFTDFDLKSALNRFPDGRRRSTTELSWFLAGLSHAAMTSSLTADRVRDLALETHALIRKNQGPSGFFGHLATRGSVAGFVRGRIGSFADQIYPVYSFSKYAEAFSKEGALDQAKKCAWAICEAQGKLGQWWWLYDSLTGRVSNRYPVYSVHQHAMAPMGLFALEKAAGVDFQENIARGLRWIYGANELGKDMRDLRNNLVWRCIRPKNKNAKYWDTALSFVRKPDSEAPPGALEILYEDWPYELGWLLYAFSRNTLKPDSNPYSTSSKRPATSLVTHPE